MLANLWRKQVRTFVKNWNSIFKKERKKVNAWLSKIFLMKHLELISEWRNAGRAKNSESDRTIIREKERKREDININRK